MEISSEFEEAEVSAETAVPFPLDIKTKPAGGWAGWAGPLAATAIAAVLRFPRLGQPHAIIFDETYYVKDSLALLNFGAEQKTVDGADQILLASDGKDYLGIFQDAASYVVHPPVGKWVIASGEALFGATPFGWRIAVAILGVLSVLLTARIARRLTNSNFIGTMAGLLIAIDGLHIAMSRTALLDTTLSFLILCAFGFLIIDRDSANAGGTKAWRWAMVVALALATATKWSGLYFAAAFGLLMLVWDFQRRNNQADDSSTVAEWFRRDLLPALLMPIAAIAIYIATWIGWFRSSVGWNRDWATNQPGDSWLPDSLVSLLHYHRDMLSFHTNLTTPHSYSANPWGWPLMIRPTSFYYETEATCGAASCSQEVIPLGNPLIWWAGIIAIGFVLFLAIRKQLSAALPIVVAFAAGWVPWLFFTERTVFTFYSVVFIPYTVMALAIGLAELNRRLVSDRPVSKRWPAATFFTIAFILTLFFYPILTGMSISYDAWHLRMWLPSWI